MPGSRSRGAGVSRAAEAGGASRGAEVGDSRAAGAGVGGGLATEGGWARTGQEAVRRGHRQEVRTTDIPRELPRRVKTWTFE